MIELRALTKSFRTVHGRHFVFRDLSLKFPDRTNIGLIGPNGAGKSTLMRIIGGIDVPDHGEVITDRRISFPVGLSGGFQGTLSGRDNAKFVCRLYGVNPREVREKVSFVENFAELGKYFDMPIKTYSSGMRSRLIFGLSMAFDFDYYLMDEVGAVGDAGFKEKSRELLEAKIGQANVICVSHNMHMIREQCDVVVLLQSGEAVYFTDIEEGIRAYQGDAYVQPGSGAGKRDRPKRLTPDSITPQLIKRARRIIRVARRAELRGRQLPADAAGPVARCGEPCEVAPASNEMPEPAPMRRPGRRAGTRPRRQRAKAAKARVQVEKQKPTLEPGDDGGASRPARSAVGRRRRSATAGDASARPETTSPADGTVAAEEGRTAEASVAEEKGAGRRQRKAARRARLAAPIPTDVSREPEKPADPGIGRGRDSSSRALLPVERTA